MSHEPYDPLPPETAVDEEPFSDYDLASYIEGWDPDPSDPMAVAGHVRQRVAGFTIDRDDLAEWALAKYAEADLEARDLGTRARNHHARIDAWLTAAAASAHRRMDFFGTHLRDYVLRMRAEHGTKSVRLPSGKLVTHGPTPGREHKVIVEDEATVIAWAKEALADEPESLAGVVKVKETVLLGGLRAITDIKGDGIVVDVGTGQVIPGVSVVEVEVTADVQPGA